MPRITIPCGIEVPASEFEYPDSSQRAYTQAEFTAYFTGEQRDKYYKSQIFIDEIFARYGYSFSETSQRPGKAIFDKYKDKEWYQKAMASCPSQSMDTLLFQVMTSTEYNNVMAVNSWQEANNCMFDS